MKLEIYVRSDDAAAFEDPLGEAERMLDAAKDAIRSGRTHFAILDANGNTVGSGSFKEA